MTRYLADESAIARLHLAPVRDNLEPLINRGLVAICASTLGFPSRERSEATSSARSNERDQRSATVK